MSFWTTTHASSASDKWTTPLDLFQDWDSKYDFQLDAAALSTSTLVPDNWYGPDHPNIDRRDAFVRDWANDSKNGAVWLNPPYGRSIKSWMMKANQESTRCKVVCLVPARTDTHWWHDFCIQHEVVFIRGRLRFGSSSNCAPFPSAFVIMG